MGSRVSSLYGRIFLRTLYAAAKASGASLKSALEKAASEAVETSSSPTVLSGTSANGASVSYALSPTGGAVSALRIAELAEELLELYEYFESDMPPGLAEAELDARVYALMMSRLKSGGIRRMTADWGGLVK